MRKYVTKLTYEEKKRHQVERSRALRAEVLAAYGGKCACCGEAHPEFLGIDHMNGGGNRERGKSGGSNVFYVALKKAGFPKDRYRLLCHNCNLARGFYGYCPHKLPLSVGE